MGGRPRFLNQEQGGEPEMAQTETPQPAAPPVVTLTQEQLNQLLAAAAGGSQAGLTAENLAKAFSKAQRPENVHAPMISVYNPRGETAHPRPSFKAEKVTQNGIELDRETLTWEEIEAINALRPGSFRVQKANGSGISFAVKHVLGMDGVTLERLEFAFPCKDEHRYDHRSLFEYCVEAIRQAGAEDEVERLMALKTQLDKERVAAKVA